MSATSYNPARVNVVFSGRTLQGVVKGESIRLTKVAENYTAQEGLAGEVTYSKDNSRRRRLEIDLMQNSPDNDFLSGLSIADRKAPGGVMYPVFVNDKNGASVYVAGSAVIIKMPDPTFGNEAGKRTWAFDLDIDEEFTGGAGEGGIIGLVGSLF